MPVQSISMNNIAFRGETAKKEETQTLGAKKPAENNGVDKKKLALALGGLAAVGVAAVCIAKGRKASSGMSIEKFKKAGGFEKVNNDRVSRTLATYKGKPYTGAIAVTNKNGNFNIQYKDGVLKEVLQTKGNLPDGDIAKNAPQDFDGIKALGMKKVYSYNDNGKLKEVARFRIHSSDDKTIAGGMKDGLLTYVKDSVTLLGDKEVTVKKTSPDFERIKTVKTVFDENGKMSERIQADQKLGKDKVTEMLEANTALI